MELADVWDEYNLKRLEEGINQLFPNWSLSPEDILQQIMEGDLWGALRVMWNANLQSVAERVNGLRSLLIWLLVLGIVSSLAAHFVDVFERHQVADLCFYLTYLLMTTVLLRCFYEAVTTAKDTLEHITLFIRLLMPVYLISVGISSGAATVAAGCQIMLLVIYGIEVLLAGGVLPVIYSYTMLVVMNSVWSEEKLALLIELLEKGIGLILKGALGVLTGISFFQTMVTPVVDSVRRTTLQKMIGAIPGVGGLADGTIELVLGSALVIKRSVGLLLLLLMLLLCGLPLLKIGLIGWILKGSAALMGMISDKRIVACVNKTGDGICLLLKMASTAMFLFLISVAVITAAGR